MPEEGYKLLDVGKIEFDTENPRIKKSLEKYKGEITAERIAFALRSATSGESKSDSSFNKLKDSIGANGGITIPITVVKQGKKYICIDGNTRLAIYKDFHKSGSKGDWSKIPALLKDNPEKSEIEKIRVSAHLVGARDWPAYEKARYLHDLYYSELMSYSEMVALCGGNKKAIESQIQAYKDMNEFYRDIVDDTAFQIDRFSGFQELQKSGIKDAIFSAGLELKDFGEWIRDGKIERLEDVRELKKGVLSDEEARKVFLSGGVNSIKDAIKVMERNQDSKRDKPLGSSTLEESTTYQIAEVLSRRINEMPFHEIRTLQNRDGGSEQVLILEELMGRLKQLLDNVPE